VLEECRKSVRDRYRSHRQLSHRSRFSLSRPIRTSDPLPSGRLSRHGNGCGDHTLSRRRPECSVGVLRFNGTGGWTNSHPRWISIDSCINPTRNFPSYVYSMSSMSIQGGEKLRKLSRSSGTCVPWCIVEVKSAVKLNYVHVLTDALAGGRSSCRVPAEG
jgi:hypothetical protein